MITVTTTPDQARDVNDASAREPETVHHWIAMAVIAWVMIWRTDRPRSPKGVNNMREIDFATYWLIVPLILAIGVIIAALAPRKTAR
jgi:hypothetical protein